MMSNLRIIKLGGSVITDKTRQDAVNHAVIAQLAEVLAEFAQSMPLIIVHGAGSCGHPQAAEWKIQEGVTAQNARGVFETHEAVSVLNCEVTAALRSAGIEAVSLPPFAASLAENGRLVYAGEQQIQILLKSGIIPVLHGDVVADSIRGACIVSGDQLVPFLAKALEAAGVGIVTQTGGVLSDDGRIVPVITRQNVSSIPLGSCSEGTDVTGGMKGKIDELLTLADAGIPSCMFAMEYLHDYLSGKEFPHTCIV